MNRRDFLKIGSMTTAAFFLQANHLPGKALVAPALLEHRGNVFLGTSDGNILVSRNFGKTWQLHTRLGKDYTVSGFSKDGSQHLYANILFGDRSFVLTLAKGDKFWLSV